MPDAGTVWHSLVPPASAAEAWISVGNWYSGNPQWSLFEGESLATLTRLADSLPVDWASPVKLPLVGGRHYWIGVAGVEEEGIQTHSDRFMVGVQMELPRGPGYSLHPGSPLPPTTYPATPQVAAPTLEKKVVHTPTRTAVFRFTTSTPQAHFVCTVDHKASRACASPFTARGLTLGKHRFSVRATIASGATSAPTSAGFRLPAAPGPRPHKVR